MKKCNRDTKHFCFDMPVNKDGLFCGNLTVSGFGCLINGKPNSDIDSVEYEGTEIKPVLELMGGMAMIDIAAEHHVAGLFEENELQAA